MRRGKTDVPNLTAARHLRLEFSDIAKATEGYALPEAEHLEELLRFARGWDLRRPLLVHCYAGVSRSTAAAFVIACALRPDADEQAVAARLRTASPTATPNPRIVALADTMLRRSGRMIHAIEAIGRGVDCFEGVPFSLDLDG